MIELPTSFLESHSSNSLTRKDVERLGSTLFIIGEGARRSLCCVSASAWSFTLLTYAERPAECIFLVYINIELNCQKKTLLLARRDLAGMYLIRVRQATIGFARELLRANNVASIRSRRMDPFCWR